MLDHWPQFALHVLLFVPICLGAANPNKGGIRVSDAIAFAVAVVAVVWAGGFYKGL